MSMHLLPVYYSSTRYSRKAKKRKPTKRQEQLNREHEKFLKKMGVKKPDPANRHIYDFPDLSSDRTTVPTSDVIPGGCTGRAERQVYSGERTLLGIATTHKSNMIPVFSKEDAVSISKMRR